MELNAVPVTNGINRYSTGLCVTWMSRFSFSKKNVKNVRDRREWTRLSTWKKNSTFARQSISLLIASYCITLLYAHKHAFIQGGPDSTFSVFRNIEIKINTTEKLKSPNSHIESTFIPWYFTFRLNTSVLCKIFFDFDIIDWCTLMPIFLIDD